MGFAINTNNDAINTYKNLNAVQNSLSKSLEKLSSGLRINQAGDDAAGLTISTQLGSQVSGLQQASRNAQDGLSLLQTADGALSQAQSILGRLRDLSVQAANDSNSTTARSAIKTEADSLVSELGRLGQSVNFNGQTLLNTNNELKFQVGADGNAQSQISVNLAGANLATVTTSLSSAYTSFAVTTPSSVKGGYTFTSSATGATAVTVDLGSGTPAFTSVQAVSDKLNADTGFAAKFVSSVDSSNNLIVRALDGGATVTAASATVTAGSNVAGAGIGAGTASSTGGLKFDSAANAQASISQIDTQIQALSTARASIGAQENRFTNAVSTIATSVTNLTAAKSRITDVDMAQEMVNFTRANVLSQAGTAMLSQANSLPQLALKLLG